MEEFAKETLFGYNPLPKNEPKVIYIKHEDVIITLTEEKSKELVEEIKSFLEDIDILKRELRNGTISAWTFNRVSKGTQALLSLLRR